MFSGQPKSNAAAIDWLREASREPKHSSFIPSANRLRRLKWIRRTSLPCREGDIFFTSSLYISLFLQTRPLLGARLPPRSTSNRRILGFHRAGLPIFKTQSQGTATEPTE
jgi:hypothetical protein